MRYRLEADFDFDATDLDDAVRILARHLLAAVDDDIQDPFKTVPKDGEIQISEVVDGEPIVVIDDHDYNLRLGEALVVLKPEGVMALTHHGETEITEHGLAAIAVARLMHDPDTRAMLVDGMREHLEPKPENLH